MRQAVRSTFKTEKDFRNAVSEAQGQHVSEWTSRNNKRMRLYEEATGIKHPEMYLWHTFGRIQGGVLNELKRALEEDYPELFEPIYPPEILKEVYGEKLPVHY